MAFDVRSATHVEGSGTSITVTAPADTDAGDRVLVVLAHNNGAHVPARSAQLEGATNYFGPGVTVRVYSVTDNTTGPWSITLDATASYAVACLAITPDAAHGSQRPVIEGVEFDQDPANSAGPAVVPAVTPPVDNDVLLSVVAINKGTTFTPPAGTTERVDTKAGSAIGDVSLFVGSEALSGGSGVSTGTRSITDDNPSATATRRHVMGAILLRSGDPNSNWSGDFSTGDDSQYRAKSYAQGDGLTGPVPRLEVKTDTPPDGFTHYARFHALDSDVAPLTPTENPRCQLNGPKVLPIGREVWVSWQTRFPADFPYIPHPPDGFLVFFQVFQSPWGWPEPTSPNLALTVDGNLLTLKSWGAQGLWRAPIIKGEWLPFAFRMFIHPDDATGWYELYYQGQRQMLGTGYRRRFRHTSKPVGADPCEAIPTNYRAAGCVPGEVYVDHAAVRTSDTPPSGVHFATLPPVLAHVA